MHVGLRTCHIAIMVADCLTCWNAVSLHAARQGGYVLINM